LLCHGTVCVVGKMRDLILQLSKSSIYSTKPPDGCSYPWEISPIIFRFISRRKARLFSTQIG
ncbi:hypothetical protein L8T16_17330, partial [Enterobacter cloacae]|nr:hypothetical protein [Enterobacter cloacae]